ncbi:MAG: YraN family protein [Candidatus Rokubacteria bacterium]|nr:YraN family protein [Candidatus Rokubacteria bacterium]
MVDPRQTLGRAAEDAAAAFLAGAGLAVVARNVRFAEGELDLVCRARDVWVFVEVKCRRASWGDAPGAAVSWRKQRRLVRLARHWLKWKRLDGVRCRFDVVEVTAEDDGRSRIRHLPAAFDATGME